MLKKNQPTLEPLDFLAETTPAPTSPANITVVVATVAFGVVLLILAAVIATFCLVRTHRAGASTSEVTVWSVIEGSPDACYTDRDEGHVDKEGGYADNLVEETVNQVLRDRRTGDSEDGMANVNAARLVESVLRRLPWTNPQLPAPRRI